MIGKFFLHLLFFIVTIGPIALFSILIYCKIVGAFIGRPKSYDRPDFDKNRFDIIRGEIRKKLAQHGINRDIGVVNIEKHYATAVFLSKNGCTTSEKFHVILEQDKVMAMIPFKGNNIFTIDSIKGNVPKQKPEKVFVEKFSKMFRENISQLEAIERKIQTDGSATVFSQSFCDNRLPGKNEFNALCKAFELEGFGVTQKDLETGKIILTT